MREVDPREKNKQEPLNKELSWAFLLSLSSFPSSATCHLNHYSWNCKNRHSPIHFHLPKEAVNRPTNFSLNALSSVTALFSHSYTLLHLLRLHPHHSLVWGRKDAAGKKITRHTSGPSTSLGVTIDYVHITLWTLSQAQRAPIDLLAQSSHGPWSTTEVPADPPFFHLCHHFVLDKSSHSSGMIIFCCGINPGDYGYGNVDWSQDLCAISSSDTVSLLLWWPCHVATQLCVYIRTEYNLFIKFTWTRGQFHFIIRANGSIWQGKVWLLNVHKCGKRAIVTTLSKYGIVKEPGAHTQREISKAWIVRGMA